MLGEAGATWGDPMNLQFKRHDGDGVINPAHVAMVELSSVGDGGNIRNGNRADWKGPR